ncbi:type II secretion system minor pseudopilin GspJ [Hydrocarboniclastica marina]|uniref:Type II secretion system protein J n=1 Tax=Hydrocarboniclastica marina TaxID=2259620 RepID=A0A4P7XHW5_9ALTE|nr:type II secretion system minor pseudopilin GspJ [Hydrocarboniclastica marina]QCF26074.1 type II secretion system protein GspJ [Hydrocarboniclastica marina]
MALASVGKRWSSPAPAVPTARTQGGFTLLEVLIAVTLTALIGVGVSQLLSSVIDAKNGIDRVSEEFTRMQRAVVVMERDLAQAVLRPVRDAYGEPMPSLTSRAEPLAIEFTRTGWRNPLRAARSDLQRVAYEVIDDRLVRYYWDVLDRAQDTLPREQELLDGVTELSWRFLNHKREWSDGWPSDTQMQNMGPDNADEIPLPLAVEFEINHQRFGRITRLIDLGDFDYEAFATVVPGQVPDGTPPEESSGETPSDTSEPTGNSNVNPEADTTGSGGNP